MKRAIRDGNLREIDRQLAAWNPLVPIPSDPGAIERTIQMIARTVDLIEEGVFKPRTALELKRRIGEQVLELLAHERLLLAHRPMS